MTGGTVDDRGSTPAAREPHGRATALWRRGVTRRRSGRRGGERRRELDAAGITDPALRAAYEACRRLNAAHGKTYYLATLLLPPAKRPLRARALRLRPLRRRARRRPATTPTRPTLVGWGDRFLADLDRGDSDHPVSRAAIHTARTWGIPASTSRRSSPAMRMDITVTGYPTYADLERYMYGSAAVIGLQMVPILEPLDPTRPPATPAPSARPSSCRTSSATSARTCAAAGSTCPQEDLDRFGVTRADLAARPDAAARARRCCGSRSPAPAALYAAAEPGIDLLHPTSRDCIRTAFAAVRRHPRRGREGRLPGARPPGRRAAAAPARPSRCPALVRARRARRSRV